MTYCVSVLGVAVSVIVIVYALMKEEMPQAGNGEPGERKYKVFTAAGFLLLLLLRIYRFGSLPPGVNQDEAMAAVDALALSNYGTDRFGMSLPVHLTAWGFGQMSALNSYLLIPFVKIWGLTTWAVRLPSLICSILGAWAVYGIVKELFGKRAALLVLFLTAVNPWHLMQSRWEIDCNLFPHFFVIGLYLLIRSVKRTGYLYVSMIFFALCMYAYGVAFYMVPFFLLVMCAVMLALRLLKVKQCILTAGVYFLAAWPICLTMLINFAGWDTIRMGKMTIPCFPDSIRAGDILFFAENLWEQLISNLRSLIHITVLQSGDSPWNAIDYFGAVYWCSMPFLPVGILCVIFKIKRTAEAEKKACLGAILIYLAVSGALGLIIANVNTNRINIIFYAQLILIAVGIEYVTDKCRGALPVTAAVYGCMTILFVNQYFTSYEEEIRDSFFVDFMAAAEEAEEHNSSRYYIALAHEYDDAANCAEILTMYAHQIDAKYFQGESSEEKISYSQESPLTGNGIPYARRYCYRIPTDEEIAQEKDAVYVLRAEQRERFPEGDFAIEDYGGFILVYPAD